MDNADAARVPSEDKFVNPYTFVTLAESPPDRSAPPGHKCAAEDRPLVRIDITWELRTPLATRAPYREEGRLGLPGSSVKGAVRSMHEALTGSCLRVVDLDAVAVHREPLRPSADEKTLARVTAISEPNPVSGERIITLALADEVVWIDVENLSSSKAIPTTGQPYDLRRLRGSVENVLGRHQFKAGEGATPFSQDAGVAWIAMASDAGARRETSKRNDRTLRRHSYHAAFGRFGPQSKIVDVGSLSEIWQAYERAAEHTDDVRRGRKEPHVDVRWPKQNGRLVAKRQVVRASLTDAHPIAPGYMFWATMSGDTVVRLATAYVWRLPGKGPVRDRLPPGFEPCQDPEALCPSCQIFGAAGDAGAAGGVGGPGYRGHVRFGPMVTEREPVEQRLAPLGTPKLSAGQFYLQRPKEKTVHYTTRDRGERPLREWGSAHDEPQLRRMRGRKFYWPADPGVQRQRRGWLRPRWDRDQAPYRADAMDADPAALWLSGTFTQTIVVAGLTQSALGGLLCALRPSLLGNRGGLDWTRSVLRMGLGKPLGLGVVAVRQMVVAVEGPQERYGKGTGGARKLSDREVGQSVDAFVGSVRPDVVRRSWPDLCAAIDPQRVDPADVTYPVDRWEDYSPHRGTRPTYKFLFWKQSAGDHEYPLRPLPQPRSGNQAMPLQPPRGRLP